LLAAMASVPCTSVLNCSLPPSTHLQEKHPGAKDREQAARLRNDYGRSSAGERVVEFAVMQPNALMSCAPTLTLRAGVSAGEEGAVAGTQGAAAGKAANGRASISSIAAIPTAAGVAGGAAAAANVLRVAIKQVGPGGCLHA
jgi:hypothetical protein